MSRDMVPTETSYVSSNESMGQGDIFTLPYATRPPFLAVLINADCDLAHGKTDGVFSLLPVYTLREYVLQFWLHRFLTDARERLLDEIARAVDPKINQRDAIERWLSSEDRRDMIAWAENEMNVKGKARNRLIAKLDRYLAAFGNQLEAEAQFQALCGSEQDPVGYAYSRLRTAVASMGDGHLLLNEIHGRQHLGYVIRMRRIYSVPEKHCFGSERALRTSGRGAEDCAFRIATLASPMQFKLLQLFAYQFSRVGLPDEFREVRELVLEELAREMTNGESS